MKLTNNVRFLNIVAGLAAVAAVGTLTVGGAWALFSASETSANNSFVAGTVTVGDTGTASTTCDVTGMMPGDSSAGFGSLNEALDACAYRVKYTGSASAFLAVDIAVVAPSAALPSSPALYTASATGLQVKVSDGTSTFMNGTTFRVLSGANTTVSAGTPVTNLLVATTPAATGDEFTFDIRYALPTLAPNSLQGGSATVTLTFHAVQSANQTSDGCTAGQQCNTITWS
ncbi:MAG: M73 family metallopeptidase [Acidobacteria bacterium]|nr:M73 family metallopeptidase [Acidobacteriota bacterium]